MEEKISDYVKVHEQKKQKEKTSEKLIRNVAYFYLNGSYYQFDFILFETNPRFRDHVIYVDDYIFLFSYLFV